MGTRLKIGRKNNLYQFWDTIITEALNNELEEGEPFINLASAEYFKAIKSKLLKVPVITPVFKDFKNGEYKMISFFAKKARGLMSRFILQNELKKPEELKHFDAEGYYFSEAKSSANELIFLRG